MAKTKKSTATIADPWAQRLGIEQYHHASRAVPRPPPPSRQLKVEDRVVYGAVKSAEVLEVFQDGLSAVLKIITETRQGHGRELTEVAEPRVVYWNEVLPLTPWSETRFTDEGSRSMWDKVRMVVTSMSSLIHLDRQWGFNDSPEYQRSYVWTEADKEALLDSIFASMDIGKFVLIQHPVPENRYEVLDGKQRFGGPNLPTSTPTSPPIHGRPYAPLLPGSAPSGCPSPPVSFLRVPLPRHPFPPPLSRASSPSPGSTASIIAQPQPTLTPPAHRATYSSTGRRQQPPAELSCQ